MKRLLERARKAVDDAAGLLVCDTCGAMRPAPHDEDCEAGRLLRDLDAAIEADHLGKAVRLLRRARDFHITSVPMRDHISAFLAEHEPQTGPEAQGSNERREP